MLNKFFKKIVMAFNANNIIVNKLEETSKPPLSSLSLTKIEIETLLMMIRETHFKGEHIQKVYELVLKLQEYYTKLS